MRDAAQAVGGIVGVSVRSIIEQVAIIVPGVAHPAHAGQAVGVVVAIGGAAHLCRLAQPVAHGVVTVMEIVAGAVIRGGQAVEWVIGVIDRDRGGGSRSALPAAGWSGGLFGTRHPGSLS